MSKQTPLSSERRSFLTRLNGGVTSLAAMAIGGVAMARGQSKASARWEPAHHDKDDWLDQLPAKHRLVFDTTAADGMGEALAFANNYLIVNRNDYGLQNSDLAVIIVVRHFSTVFGYNDAIWAKYGKTLSDLAKFVDPKTKAAPKTNLYNAADAVGSLPSLGVTLDSLAKQGVRFAVCGMATGYMAGAIAREVNATAEAINAELNANLVANARMVPAGIVAVNRAQERGYSLVSA
jgi:intracellular sulfur oxidation DsrE/DsrF family protein